MKVRIILLAITVIINFGACGTDPEKHPEYIGTWISPQFGDDGMCDYLIKIPADGKGLYGNFGEYCGSTLKTGFCCIKKEKIEIAGKNFKIIEAPHSIPLVQLQTVMIDTVEVTKKMRLHWSWFLFQYERDFYKVD